MMLLSIVLVLISLSVHEFSHAITAYWFGDDTAKKEGRLSLNPIKHIDPFGTIILPLLLVLGSKATGGLVPVFGWAKPVPIDFRNFKYKRLGLALTALAGPLSNIIIAFVATVILIQLRPPQGLFLQLLIVSIQLNLLLAIFNMIPLPPLDGSRIVTVLLPRKLAGLYNRLGILSFILIIVLLQTNLLDKLFLVSATWFVNFVAILFR